MLLSIITINKNNLHGLKLTLQSVKKLISNIDNIEHIIIDGNSCDGSIDEINLYRKGLNNVSFISENDNGIYDAMNKGIRHASGQHLIFINSGDYLLDFNLIDLIKNLNYDIVYCNLSYGSYVYKPEENLSLFHFIYGGIMAHPASFIRRDLFFKFGFYKEDFKIISDWIFFLNAVIINNCTIKYININITVFDQTGISSNQNGIKLANIEKKSFLFSTYPRIYIDYLNYESRLNKSFEFIKLRSFIYYIKSNLKKNFSLR
jgi:glycosyltransferase involved in cell wall biosynthesis